MTVTLRPATLDDIPALTTLIADSARGLSAGFYSAEEAEALIAHVYGVDSELIADGSYFIALIDGEIAGCGGWSRRKKLFGGDAFAGEEGFADPASEPAKIRAFFVDPRFARRGVGTALLEGCEAAARRAGFTRAGMMVTLPGVPLYERAGYRVVEEVVHPLPNGVVVRYRQMEKRL